MKYKEIYLPNHHRAKTNGYVYEHILLAEDKLGRLLKDGECVHHKDLNKLNNKPENLMVFINNSAHIAYHKGGKLISLEDGTFDCETLPDAYCKVCGVKLKTKQAKICQICLHIKQRKCKRPSKEQLKQDIIEFKTNVAIAKKYGVSDKTISKWKKMYFDN